MSAKGIYSAVSGAMAQDKRVETIANNLANANTTGFKKDKQTFHEYVTANEKPPDVIQVPKVPASIESFYDMQGGDKSYVDAKGTFTDLSQGALKNTGGKLDVAIEGRGFFEVMTPSGPMLTRNGSFKLDGQGRIVNNDGHPILLEGLGQDPAQRVIQASGNQLTVASTGEVYDGQDQIGKISVLDIQDAGALKKQGGSLYSLKENYGEQLRLATDYKLHQGFLEMSNVNILEEMTDLIKASRVFEATQKAIQGHDDMDEKLVNQVPRTS